MIYSSLVFAYVSKAIQTRYRCTEQPKGGPNQSGVKQCNKELVTYTPTPSELDCASPVHQLRMINPDS